MIADEQGTADSYLSTREHRNQPAYPQMFSPSHNGQILRQMAYAACTLSLINVISDRPKVISVHYNKTILAGYRLYTHPILRLSSSGLLLCTNNILIFRGIITIFGAL